MTRNNLQEHLSWLLETKPSIPSPATSLPAASLSFSSDDQTQAQAHIPSQRDTETDAPLLTNRAHRPAPHLPTGVGGREDMAKLRTAPGSATKHTLVSMGTVPPASVKTTRLATPSLHRSEAPHSAHPEPAKLSHRHNRTGDANDVEVMDLTESIGAGQIRSPLSTRNVGESSSRKRKSPELDSDTWSTRRVKVEARQPLASLPQASQQDFAIIDEVMDKPPEPPEPPPPYSTIAPRFLEKSRSLAQIMTHQIVRDSEDDDDDLVNFAGVPTKRSDRSPPASKVTSSSTKSQDADTTPVESPAPRSSQSVDAELLKRCFDLPTKDVRKLLDDMDAARDGLCDRIAWCIDQDQDDEGQNLQQKLDDLDVRCNAIQALVAQRADYKRLCSEKEQLFAALRHAIKSRQGVEAAKGANNAGKQKLAALEAQCWKHLQACKEDLRGITKATPPAHDGNQARGIAVHSTQAIPSGYSGRDIAESSSSRIVQTQVVRPDGIDRRTAGPVTSHANGSSYHNIAIPPCPNTRRSQPPQAPRPHLFDGFDDVDDSAMLGATSNTLSRRMFTPPPLLVKGADDDFDILDDDEMLEFVEDAENNVLRRHVERPIDRPVFEETSGNSRPKPPSASAKKSKKSSPPKPDNDIEAEFFRYPWGEDVKVTLKQRFRLRGFRQSQLQAINATLSGKDVFVLMPTGGGKSLCYQLPSLIKSGKTQGVTIVVSPLLSLMEDQVQHLRKLNINAFVLNSETTREERDALMSGLGEQYVQEFVQLLYVTPEMLSKSQRILDVFDQLYRRQRLARLVIDEAHCVSQWGHDFRPDYKLIGDVRRKFPQVPVMALTATATENVKVDTIHNLGIKGCEVFSQSFNRPNLHYEVRKKSKGKEDINDIAELIKTKHSKQSGIVYCLSRKNCEDMAETLTRQHKIKAHFYHAGMKSEEKKETQRMWQAGRYHVIVATIAFGMGIDKPDVRYVVHHSMPKSLEGYYQETGRAGRDGLDSGCYLYYGFGDASKLRRMIDEGEGSWEQKERQRLMLRKMVQYCENRADCRRSQVLGYFNESFDRDACGEKCDNCASNSTFEMVDYTDYARAAVKIVEAVADDKVTLLHCIDVFRGTTNSKIKEKGHSNLDDFGSGRGLDRGDVERLFYRLVSEDVLHERNVVNKRGFANQYVELGRKSNTYSSDRQRMMMQIRSTPRAKTANPPAKKKARKDANTGQISEWKATAGSRHEMPLSTNVSSPVQAASTRRNAKQSAKRGMQANGYIQDDFVASDDDFGQMAESSSDSEDAFGPVRIAGRARVEQKRVQGPPITGDSIMAELDDVHQMVVDEFLTEAKKKANDIMLGKSLKNPPFSDTILRHMIIHFTDTEEEMAKIPGIQVERIKLYGKFFCRLVQEWHGKYEEMMGGQAGQQSAGPDVHARNVIDLVSDDEEDGGNDDDDDDDEYGSINDVDLDDGEPSAYFHQTLPRSTEDQQSLSKKLEAFNARIAQTQVAAARPDPPPSLPARKPFKGKARHYRATTRGGASGARRNSEGGGVAKKTRRTGGGGAGKSKRSASSKGRADAAFAMMPT